MAKAKIKNVALLFPLGSLHEMQVYNGILDYVSERTQWEISINPEWTSMSLHSLNGWPGDGVIVPLATKADVRVARAFPIPVVNVWGNCRAEGVPRVMVDQEAVGRLAAEHLLERGFRRFAYYGMKGLWFAQLRRRGFAQRIREAGGELSVLETPQTIDRQRPWHGWVEPLRKWLETLTLPVGLMAVHDYRARFVIVTCIRMGLNVPHDVAVIGVDNDMFPCELGSVTLSSVARNARKEGYEIAALLDRLMAGKPPPPEDILLPPLGVVQRLSTSVEAIEDEHVAAVSRYIRDHIREEFSVVELCKMLPVSRRTLERRFEQVVGCSPLEYVNRMRVRHAKHLLRPVNKMRMEQIAAACGFSDGRHFREVFQRLAGLTPTAYRRAQGEMGTQLISDM